MHYTPQDVIELNLPEADSSGVAHGMPSSIIRGLTVVGRGRDKSESYLVIHVNELTLPLWILAEKDLGIGDEPLGALEYFSRVIEPGDRIDVVTSADQPDPQVIFLEKYWIEIQYVGAPSSTTSTRNFKEDGMFAMRAKGGEKAERRAARVLASSFGHTFPPSLSTSPGCFQIYYEGKGQRKADRVCLTCGLKFEVKKRNWDQHFRVSHSDVRPFDSENAPGDWHAFVFRDMKPRFVPNAQISLAIQNKQFKPGKDKYDSYAQIFPSAIKVCNPPPCTSNVLQEGLEP